MKNKFLVFILLIISAPFIYSQQPYIILISFDGFRWDYPSRGISPAIDSMTKNGVSALSLRSCFPSKTFPNHLSIITGMYPENHGIIMNKFPDPFNKEIYSLGNDSAVSNSRWYLGEPFWETAGRNGIKSSSFFWPGSELNIDYRRPDYHMHYDESIPILKRVAGVLDWLKLPYDERPHFITLYFSDTDDAGHDFGPESPETNNAIKIMDNALDSLYRGLKEIGLKDSINVILLSDHGMTAVSKDKMINVDEILNGLEYEIFDNGPVMMIFPDEISDDEIYNRLKKYENHYKVYFKNEVPDYLNFSKHPFIAPIVLIADLGWSLVDNFIFIKENIYSSKGNHGYDPNETDMHGIFFAEGPAFKKGYKTGTLWNIDIYPLLCKIFDIQPRSNIDGSLERIEFILKP